MDVHVPAAITEGLRRQGIDVLTSQDDGTRKLDDESLLQRASDLKRVLFSQDVDLLRIAHQWQSQGCSFTGVIFAHQQRIGIGQCSCDLALIAECCDPGELANSCGPDCPTAMIRWRIEKSDPALPRRYPAFYPAPVDCIWDPAPSVTAQARAQ